MTPGRPHLAVSAWPTRLLTGTGAGAAEASPRRLSSAYVGRLAGLDAVRVIACIMVFLSHASELDGDSSLAGLKNGVMLFFALSGYLLYRPFADGKVDLRGYAVHRIARILPAYVAALIGLTIFTGNQSFISHPLAYLTFSQNYDPALWLGFVGVSWTLAIEVAFYITLPLIAWIVAGKPSRLLMIGALSCLAAESVAIASWPDFHQISSLYPFMIWTFVPGMLVALGPRIRSPWALVLGIGFLLVGTQSPWVSVDLASGIGSGLVVAWVVGYQPSFGRLMPFVGGAAAISYSAYLWHQDFIRTFGSLEAIVVTVAVASVIYLAVERPMMRLGRRIAAPKQRADQVIEAMMNEWSPVPVKNRA